MLGAVPPAPAGCPVHDARFPPFFINPDNPGAGVARPPTTGSHAHRAGGGADLSPEPGRGGPAGEPGRPRGFVRGTRRPARRRCFPPGGGPAAPGARGPAGGAGDPTKRAGGPARPAQHTARGSGDGSSRATALRAPPGRAEPRARRRAERARREAERRAGGRGGPGPPGVRSHPRPAALGPPCASPRRRPPRASTGRRAHRPWSPGSPGDGGGGGAARWRVRAPRRAAGGRRGRGAAGGGRRAHGLSCLPLAQTCRCCRRTCRRTRTDVSERPGPGRAGGRAAGAQASARARGRPAAVRAEPRRRKRERGRWFPAPRRGRRPRAGRGAARRTEPARGRPSDAPYRGPGSGVRGPWPRRRKGRPGRDGPASPTAFLRRKCWRLSRAFLHLHISAFPGIVKFSGLGLLLQEKQKV